MKMGLKASLILFTASSLLITQPTMATENLDWTGFHVAGGLGYGMFKQKSFVQVNSMPVTAMQADGAKGWLGRMGLGYNYEWCPRIVVGAFGDYDFMDIKGQQDFPGVVGDEKQTNAWYLGGLVGYKLNPLTLVLIDAGYTKTHLTSVNYALGINGGSFAGISLSSHKYSGAFLGIGMETLLTGLKSSCLFLRTEYRVAGYNDANIAMNDTLANFDDGDIALHSRLITQTFTTSLNWKFL